MAFWPLKRLEEDNGEISNFGAKTEAAGTKTKESFRVKFSCQIKAAGHLGALRTPTDVWEAGGHIWEVVRTQGSRLERPQGRRQSETVLPQLSSSEDVLLVREG